MVTEEEFQEAPINRTDRTHRSPHRHCHATKQDSSYDWAFMPNAAAQGCFCNRARSRTAIVPTRYPRQVAPFAATKKAGARQVPPFDATWDQTHALLGRH